MTLNGLLRRLQALRIKRQRRDASDPKSAASSSDSALNRPDFTASTKPPLPDELMFKCLDYVENPFTLVRMRQVNRAFRDYVDQRLAAVHEMDVRRVNFDAVSTSSSASSCSTSDSALVLLNGRQYHVNPHGFKLLARLDGDRIEFVVDESWNSTEISLLCSAMGTFRQHVKRIRMDAPIIELLTASLSYIDLQRWFAFTCYLQAINDTNVHIRFNQPTGSGLNEKPDSTPAYWPQAESLIIRTTAKDTIHLARLLDYGVNSRRLLDRRQLQVLQVELVDADAQDQKKTNRGLNRNLYHFRCWAGSPGFDDRYRMAGGVA